MPTFNNGESAASVRTKINAAIDKVDGASPITTVNIDGGTIDGTVIGGSTPAAITGTTITGTSFVSSGDMTFGDNDKAIFGAGSDLQIYHDGSHSYISDQGTGSLYLQGQGNIELQNAAGTETFALFVNNGKSELYYDNAAKLATTATGVDVTGTITSDGLAVDGQAVISSSSFDPLYLRRTSTASTTLVMENSNNDGGALQADSDGLRLYTRTSSSFDQRIRLADNGDISFYEDTGTTPKFFWDASAESLGIGTSSPADPLHVYTSDTGVARLESTSANSYLRFITSADTNGYVGYESNDMVIYANNSKVATFDSGGNVGIGVVPSAWRSSDVALQLGDTVSEYANFVSAGAGVTYGAGWYRDSGGFKYTHDNVAAGRYDYNYTGSNVFSWHQAAAGTAGNAITFSEVMRIDSSGNLLVGQSTSTAPASGNVIGAAISPLGYISTNRTSVSAEFGTQGDGDIVVFRKSGTAVGSIGTSGGYTKITSGNGTFGSGLSFNNVAINPINAAGSVADATVKLGDTTSRFTDLYLSGGVYLGGTTSANLLDDYEEGTFSPVIRDATSGGNTASSYLVVTGRYTKVGRMVHATIIFVDIDTTGMTSGNSVFVTGLPFTAVNSFGFPPALVNVSSVSTTNGVARGSVVYNTDYLSLSEGIITGGAAIIVSDLTSGSADIYINLSYEVQ